MGKDTRFPVRVLNDFRSPVILYKGAVIGRCLAVEAIVNCNEQYQESEEFQEAGRKTPDFIRTWLHEVKGLERVKAKRLLERNDYIFNGDCSKSGRTAFAKHRIDTGDTKPIRQVPRRVPLAKREEAKQIIQDMQQSGVIEPSKIPWSSPVVLVKNKDGSTRFCVDYRKLNEVTKEDSYPSIRRHSRHFVRREIVFHA